MSEEQQLLFVLGGGLDSGITLSSAALDRAKERLKQLLLVRGLACWVWWAGWAAAGAGHALQ